MQPTTATRPAPLVSLAEFIARGELNRYMPGLPEPTPVTAESDRATAAAMTCGHCRRKTVSYRPFMALDGSGYRAYGRCRSCGHTVPL